MMNSSRIEQLKKYLEESPDDPFLHYALALEYQDNQPLRAREIYDQLLAEFPEYLPTYYHAAHLFWLLEELEKARSVFEDGIKLAEKKKDLNTLRELQNSLTNFELETE